MKLKYDLFHFMIDLFNSNIYDTDRIGLKSGTRQAGNMKSGGSKD